MEAQYGGLTDQVYWDDYWDNITLPSEMRHEPGAVYVNSILGVFDRHLPKDPGFSVAELGGSPGQYLAYLHRSLGYRVTSIDYSKVGCEKTIENFRMLGIDGTVIRADIFGVAGVVGRHVRLVRPGGYLVLGVPNLRGINGWFMRRLRPVTYATHETAAMDLESWSTFEARFKLREVFKGYIGGFEPRIFRRREESRPSNLVVFAIAVLMDLAVHGPFEFLRRRNGPRISGYAMAVYRVPESVETQA
jgi:SAM-dependent methyltransferase